MGALVPLIEAPIRRENVLHFLGYPEGRSPPTWLRGSFEAALAEARSLARPRGAWVRLAPEEAPRVGLERREAAGLVVGLVTAGDAIEARARELARRGETTRALYLDAAGSAAVEEAADALSALVASDPGDGVRAGIGCRISPGYGSWNIESQPALFSVLPHAAVGVALLPSGLMVPEKSISFALWLGAGPGPGLPGGCAACPLERCRYRRGPRPRVPVP